MTNFPRFILVLILAAVLISAATNASAADTSSGGQSVHVLTGMSVVINVQARLRRVLVSNPIAVEAVATTPTQVVVEGKAPGKSSLILWDEAGNSRMLDVTVDQDVSGLRTAIEDAFPNNNIEAEADGGRVILSGMVPDKSAMQEVMKMAGLYSKDVVNSMTLPPESHLRQILLEVKIAEIDRTKLNELGFNILSTGAGNTVGSTSTQQYGAPLGAGGAPFTLSGAIGAPTTGTSTSFGLSNLLNIFLFRPDLNLGATIQALQQANVLQILAAPNLLALSGQKASFLAGGEFPFPVLQGGTTIGAVTIQFRPFGVHLDFTGYVEPDNTIQLQVATEVSSLDYTNAVTISGFTEPALSTRRAESVVELRDGQSFGIAGLLDQRVTTELSKIPGIGDVPVLGKLFQSKSIQKTRTELIVLATPRIVDPVRTGATMGSVPKPAVPYMQPQRFDKTQPGNKKVTPQTQ
jgi:pilus assembly protein CpaC